MPRKPSKNTHQAALRYPEEWVPILDAIAEKLHKQALSSTRSDALRHCLLRGIQTVAAEMGIEFESE